MDVVSSQLGGRSGASPREKRHSIQGLDSHFSVPCQKKWREKMVVREGHIFYHGLGRG